MSFFLGLGGFFMLLDAFDGHWSERKQWEVIVGLTLMTLAVITAYLEDD